MKVNVKELDVETNKWKLFCKVTSFIQNYWHKKLDKEIDDFILEFLNSDDFEINSDSHYLFFLKNDVLLKIWIANKFYAYANSGIIEFNDELIIFDDCLPSKELRMRLFAIESAYRKYIKGKEEAKREEEKEKINRFKAAIQSY